MTEAGELEQKAPYDKIVNGERDINLSGLFLLYFAHNWEKSKYLS
jgi:hypothetical protein